MQSVFSRILVYSKSSLVGAQISEISEISETGREKTRPRPNPRIEEHVAQVKRAYTAAFDCIRKMRRSWGKFDGENWENFFHSSSPYWCFWVFSIDLYWCSSNRMTRGSHPSSGVVARRDDEHCKRASCSVSVPTRLARLTALSSTEFAARNLVWPCLCWDAGIVGDAWRPLLHRLLTRCCCISLLYRCWEFLD